MENRGDKTYRSLRSTLRSCRPTAYRNAHASVRRLPRCGASLLLAASALCAGCASAPHTPIEYRAAHALLPGDSYIITIDGFKNGPWEGSTEPRQDANDGSSIAPGQVDNPCFQRHNVTAAHVGACAGNYWYTRRRATAPGEADPCSPQWVDYRPPIRHLGSGWYRIVSEYRNSPSRAPYAVPYVIHHAGGVATVAKCQKDGPAGQCVTFELGTFQLDDKSFVHVEDTGCESITFNEMRFVYLGRRP